MIKFWSICQNTFLQIIRQPIYGVLIVLTFAILALTLPLSGWTVGSEYQVTDQKMFVNLGLSTLLVASLLIAAFASSSVLSREIEQRTALTVISKPVTRATFVLGKFVGVIAAVALAFYLSSLVFLMLVRHGVISAASDPMDWPVIVIGAGAFALVIVAALLGNLIFGWSVVAAGVWSALGLMTLATAVIAFIGKGWRIVPFGEGIGADLIAGIMLMFLATVILSAVAVAASTRLGQIATLLVALGAFAIGSMHPFLFGRREEIVVARVLGWITPNLTFFFPLDALTMEKSIPFVYVAQAAAYCAVYSLGVLAAGIALFHTRQLEAQETSASMPGAVTLIAWIGRVAAVVLAGAALVIASLPAWHTVAGLALAGGLLAGAVVAWLFWGFFARGARWAWWVVLVAACLVLIRYAALTLAGELTDFMRLGASPQRLAIQSLAAALLLAVILLPKTRRHFRTASR